MHIMYKNRNEDSKFLRLKEKNPSISFYTVHDKEFSVYGKLIDDFDTIELIKAGKERPMPSCGSTYVPSAQELEELSISGAITDKYFGGIGCQIGLCWGYNTDMNAMEYHKSSEINVAITDMVLLLAHIWDIKDDGLSADNVKAFYVKAGEMVEIYASSLHYCPCQTSNKGFYAVVILPRGTNTELEIKSDDKLLYMKNKWLICHEKFSPLVSIGVKGLISGENYSIKY